MCGARALARVLATVCDLSRRVSVSEPDVVELNAAGSGRCLGNRRRSNLDGRVQQLENAFAGCHRRLQNIVLLAEILNGTEEALRVLDESSEDANRSSAADNVISAEPDHTSDRSC